MSNQNGAFNFKLKWIYVIGRYYIWAVTECGDLYDHIVSFNQLVCQLLNADDKTEDEEQTLLLLASLLKSYKSIVQTMLVGKTTTKMDEVTSLLSKNERMLRNEYSQREDQVVAVACSEQGRSQSKRRGSLREKSQFRSRDMSNVLS